MFCPKCGIDVDQNASYCKNCGAPLNGSAGQNYSQGPYPQYTLPLKSSGLSAVLAFLVPGLGHIYLGQIGKGLLYLLAGIVLIITGFILIIPLIIYFIVWIWQIYDAYNQTEEYNRSIQSSGQKPW